MRVSRCDKGKGLFAARAFAEGEVVLTEPPLAAIQHERNTPAALACAHCFQYLVSVEHQVARRLLRRAVPAAAAGEEHPGDAGDDGDPVAPDSDEDEDARLPPVDAAQLELHALLDGRKRLPQAEHFPLPCPLPCPGGCDAQFCSAECATTCWDAYHSLLCPGQGGLCADKAQLRSFRAHARRSNDIFFLAAKIVAIVALRAQAALGGQQEACTASEAQRFEALRVAWTPCAAAHRLPWHACVAMPPDVPPSGAAAFRDSLRRLADASRRRLAGALGVHAQLFPALFHPDTFAHIIGMFELNNLDVVVESPVERYFLHVDDLVEGSAERQAAMEVSQPLLDALDAGYATHLDGTGFFPLVACINHSCDPSLASTKGERDVDGKAVLVATRDIQQGEELFVSYIDASEGSSPGQRRQELRDYGFVCACTRCVREEAAPARRGKTK